MKWGYPFVLVFAAAASAVNLLAFKLENLMATDWSRNDAMLLGALAAIIVLAVTGLLKQRKPDGSPAGLRLAVIAIVVVAVGFIPRIVVARERIAAQAINDRQREAQRTAGLASRKQDLEARIAANKTYAPDEAMAFLKFVEQSGHPPHNTEVLKTGAFNLLERALEKKLIDPNMIVKDRLRADLGPEPLFIHYHRWIRQVPSAPVKAWDWRIMLLLAHSGADLSRQDAAPVAADLRKTATPAYNNQYFELK